MGFLMEYKITLVINLIENKRMSNYNNMARASK